MAKQFISLDQAVQMTTKYRDCREKLTNPTYGPDVLPICESFDRTSFDTVLAQEGCKGLRVYLGMSDDGLVKLIIVGVNGDDQDMIPKTVARSASASTSPTLGEDEDQIIDQGIRCPHVCPPPSSLNQ